MRVMTANAFARLAASGRRVLFPKGSELVRQGDAASSLFLIEQGCVSVRREHRQVSDAVVLGLLGPGEVVGEAGLLDGAPRSATVLAVEDTVAVEVSADVVRAVTAEHPDLYGDLARILTQGLRATNELAADAAGQGKRDT